MRRRGCLIENSNSKQSSGQATCDRVFILGNEEFEQYGITESRLRTFASPYAKRRGVFCSAESDAFIGQGHRAQAKKQLKCLSEEADTKKSMEVISI